MLRQVSNCEMISFGEGSNVKKIQNQIMFLSIIIIYAYCIMSNNGKRDDTASKIAYLFGKG